MKNNLIEFNGMWFSENTPEQVKRVLVNAQNSHRRLRVWYGGDDAKSWDEENDVCGYIGKSTGTHKIPLLIHNKSSMGGGALLDDCIIKIVDTKTKVMLYQHENFTQSIFTFDKVEDIPNWKVLKDGKIYACCSSLNGTKRFCDFMNGLRMSK